MEKDIFQKIEKKVELIVKKVSVYMSSLNIEYIRDEVFKAYNYSKEAHNGQNRLSGEPYIIHPVEATLILLELKPDIYSIQTCLLHDVIEDTPKTKQDIEDEFGSEVAFLCEGLAKLSKVRYHGEERNIGSLRKMFVAMAEDLRVIFVKLSDRLHNMKTLKYHPKPEKRVKISLETLNMYAPIADRLGLFTFKNSLEIECFKILDSEGYKDIRKQFKEIKSDKNIFIKSAEKKIDELLVGKVENYKIDYRVKSMYSVYKKLKRKGLTHISELFDIFGIRIMVNTESECYKVLGIIHNNWTPLPQRFKDYIALPKPNGYKSLHTSVMGIFEGGRKQPTEIQIKTFKMSEYADIGVAAHFEYKEKGSKIAKDIDWVKELKEMVDSLQDSDFVGSLKVDVFKDRIYVFTPKGDFINLPTGSTPIDFAYSLHSELGDHIILAKVNNFVHPLDKELKNGDVVEIIIDKNKSPNPFRISFVRTVKAKNKIKAYLKKEDKELHRERGKELMSKYLETSGVGKIDKDLTLFKNIDGKVLTIEERLSLLEQVGNFSLPPSVLLRRILRSNKSERELQIERENRKRNKVKKQSQSKSEITQKKDLVIGGEVNLDYKLCYCCRRKLTNDIVAHINKSGVITIHKRNCKILDSVNKDRLLPAYIDGEKIESLIFLINLLVNDKIGVLKKISDVIFSMKIDIDSINTKKIGNIRTEISLGLRIPYQDYLVVDRVIDRLKLELGTELVDYNVSLLK